MPKLHLNLKKKYFDQIGRGSKKWEYRIYNEYWRERLIGKRFDGIVLKNGYPRSDEIGRMLTRPWRGYRVTMVRHPHFGPRPVKVFAIRVN